MRVISEKKLREFRSARPEAEQPLRAWLKRTEGSTWDNFAELRADYPTHKEYDLDQWKGDCEC